MELTKHNTTGRILDIFELLAEHNQEGMHFSEIARVLDIPKSSLQPLIATLHHRGYISFLTINQKYYLGEQLFCIGNCYTKRSDIIEQIKEAVTYLSIDENVTCFFGVLSGNKVLYLLRVNSPGNIQISAAPGYRIQAHCTAIGKALLADKKYDELDRLFPDGLAHVTQNTIIDLRKLYDQLQQVRLCGLSYEYEESSQFIRCVASPIRYRGKVIAAVSSAFPIFTKKDSDISVLEKNLMQTAKKIEDIISLNPEKWTYSPLSGNE